MGLFGKKKDEESNAAPPAPAAPPPTPGQPQSVEQMMAGYDPAVTERQMERASQMLGTAGKFGKLMGGDVAARIAAAQQNLAGAQQQMGGLAAMGGGAAVGSQSWMDAVLHPQSDFVRHCTCAECGGEKKLPSPTAYMYCDYCSALVDYDFRKVVSGSAAPEKQVPDAAYAQWINQIGADKRAAKEAGDKAKFAELEQQFFDGWITNSPNAVSHRVGDPVYRKAYLDYMVANSVATSFDPKMQSLDEEMKTATKAMVYGGSGGMSMQINADSFWPLLDVVMRQQQIALDLSAAAGVPDLDPDKAPDAVRRRMGVSTMVQGWMPYLSAEAGEEMLKRTGLEGEYSHIEPVVDGQTRHCGKCGEEFIAMANAKVCVCDKCGHKLDVGSAEWPCGNCGGLMTMPAGEPSTTCPYCKSLVERVGR
jgi:DNA-directed RNA polymerase subunit RPC12/RpoP